MKRGRDLAIPAPFPFEFACEFPRDSKQPLEQQLAVGYFICVIDTSVQANAAKLNTQAIV